MAARPGEIAGGPNRVALSAGSDDVGRAGWGWSTQQKVLLTTLDALMIGLAIAGSFVLRFGLDTDTVVSGTSLPYPFLALVLGLIWVAMLEVGQTRSRRVLGLGLEEPRRVLESSLRTFGALAIGSYLAHIQLSRVFFLVAFPLGLLLLITGRALARASLRRQRRRGGAMTSTLIVGSGPEVASTVADLQRTRLAGYEPVAACLVDSKAQSDVSEPLVPISSPHSAVDQLPHWGLNDIPGLARAGVVDAVVIAGGLSRQQVRELAWSLEGLQTELLLVPQLVDVAGPRIEVSGIEGLDMLHLDLPSFTGWKHWVKRAFDIVFALFALVLLSPVFLAVAIAIRKEDGGPVIFRQLRIGQGGTPFLMPKFRTMVPNAEARLAELLPAGSDNPLLFKAKEDPRVTRIGRFLRRHSIDEAPQFWSVLVGQMSVVGPRPPLPREVASYSDQTHRRLLIKPGLTGLWQVNGRSDLSIDESIRLDLHYVENWSLAGDLVLIAKTVKTVLFPVGAY